MFDTTTILLLAVAVLILLNLRMKLRSVRRTGRERPPSILRGIIAGALFAALILVFYLLFDYFGFARSLVVQMAIIACAAAVASFISRRIVEWKTGLPAESVNS